jgi:predicted hydrocarbon binding protein
MNELNTVKVPTAMEPLFEKAQDLVQRYFKDRNFSPEQGTIMIGDQRYILMRAESISVSFFEYVHTTYPTLDDMDVFSVAGTILYDLANGMGKSDAKVFARKMAIDDPIARLSCGPVHFAYAGWASVDISPESTPSMDENYYLLYDHPYSFESATWLENKERAHGKVCFLNSGYSAGWCENSFGVPLVAREILCRAHGDAACRFIMAPPSRIDERVEAYRQAHPELFENSHG